MLDISLDLYVRATALLLMAFVIAIATLHARLAGFTTGRLLRAISVLAIYLSLWYALAVGLAEAKIFSRPTNLQNPPIILLFLFGGPLGLIALARFTNAGQALFAIADQRYLIGLHATRVLGWVFLMVWLADQLPWQFAIPAGIGDILAGLFAFGAVLAINRGDENASAKVMRANIIGIADFALAVGMAIITSEGIPQLLAFGEANIVNDFPLALFPTFIVPILLAFHAFSLIKLREDRQRNLT